MNILSQGHAHALYKNAKGSGWVGRLSYFERGKELLPLLIGDEHLIIEFVLPEHLLNSDKAPKYYFIDDGVHFLMRKNYREINLYKLSENNYMGMIRGDELTFSSPESGPLFISTIRSALCYYVSINPDTTQFIFQAKGSYGDFISKTLTNRDDEMGQRYRVNTIPELKAPYYGFELDIVSLAKNYDQEAL